MPRPNAAQIAYGSLTVIVSAFVLLLLAPAGSVAVTGVRAAAARRASEPVREPVHERAAS
jgi:hypothetical protein